MRDVVIIGVGMTPFGRFMDQSPSDLAVVACWNAIKDANVSGKDIQTAWVGNCLAGIVTGQQGIRGQVFLREAGFSELPITNVENACATAGTALRGVWMEIALGLYDVGLALGVEKMYVGDRAKQLKALAGLTPSELRNSGFQFTADLALHLKKYMRKYGATREDFAKVVVKNSYNGSLNPYGQYRKPRTVEEVLSSRMIADPLTLLMCASIGDGAAAAVVCAKEVARKYTDKPLVHIGSVALKSGAVRQPGADEVDDIRRRTAEEAYNRSGIGPEDIDVAELHDAIAPNELRIYEALGFCKEGEGAKMLNEGRTAMTGDIPVNTSGGLIARGHPIGATGLAQVAEIVWQLRGEAGDRQVDSPKVGLCQDAGGWLGEDNAACDIIILKK
ncbi:MAG: thiolase family protein [Deltaproteobacteria bacterium]|nr:MAG: thiolase family protein [Deltaproteobacteria bacterium]